MNMTMAADAVVGQGMMLPVFEKAVGGTAVGDSKTFDLAFPEDYHAKDLAGQTVQFRIRLPTDASTGRVPDGFYLDDVEVQGCVAAGDGIFADGFE